MNDIDKFVRFSRIVFWPPITILGVILLANVITGSRPTDAQETVGKWALIVAIADGLILIYRLNRRQE